MGFFVYLNPNRLRMRTPKCTYRARARINNLPHGILPSSILAECSRLLTQFTAVEDVASTLGGGATPFFPDKCTTSFKAGITEMLSPRKSIPLCS
jgi:hypothetical protein